MIMDKAGQRWLIQLMEHVTKLSLAATAAREALTIGFPQRADQRVAVLAADLAAPVAMPGIDCHYELVSC